MTRAVQGEKKLFLQARFEHNASKQLYTQINDGKVR